MSADDATQNPHVYKLKHGESAGDGIRRVISGRLQTAIVDLGGIEDDPTRAVHEARKNLKMTRSAIRLVRDDLGRDRSRAENARLRDAGRMLSDYRDADASRETLAALAEHFSADLSDAEATALRDAAGGSGTEGGEVAPELSASARTVIAELETVLESVGTWSFERSGWKLLEPGLRRSYRGGRNALRELHRDASAENVHELRKRVKDLWYQLRLLRNSWESLIGETVDRAHELADLLGDHHDLTVLLDRPSAAPGSRVRELALRRQDELVEAALPLADRLYAEKPNASMARFEAYWRIWRSEQR